jgi:ABC-2 type transport system ATP-binding protein
VVAAIETKALTKTYRPWHRRGGQPALRGVELSIPQGSAFGLIGPNGAGKTTFIKILLGIVQPDGGEVRLLGGDPSDPAVRARIGYLPERLHLPGAWKPLEFLRSVSSLKGIGPTDAELRALVERVGLAEAVGRKIGGYSKGMKQRLGLAAALLGKPDLLVLDEPTDGIDPLGRVEVRNILTQEIARGATLFLNSHLLAETERVCDRIGVLGGGKLLREGPLSDLRNVGSAWRARFSPAPVDVLQTAGFSAGENGLFRFTGEAAALNQALDQARAAGAMLVELHREEKALEDVLAEAMGEAA